MKTYNLFISHSWNYTFEYYKLINLLTNVRYFRWKNYSVSPDYCFDTDQIISNKKMEANLKRQIKPVSCVLIIGGKYINYREWILKEIDLSLSFDKPIIGILPWGIRQVPEIFRNVCRDIIGWNVSSVVNSIKNNSL